MQFKEFDWLSGYGIVSHYTMPYKYDKRTREIWGHFYFHFSLVLHDFEGFLIKQSFHSSLLDMR